MRFRPDNRPKISKLPANISNLLDAAYCPAKTKDGKAPLNSAHTGWARNCVQEAYQHVANGLDKPVAQVVHAFATKHFQRLLPNPNSQVSQIEQLFIDGMHTAINRDGAKFQMGEPNKDLIRLRNLWAMQHPELRRRIAYEVAKSYVSKKIAIEIADKDGADTNIEILKFNSDPFEAIVIWNLLVAGFMTPEDYGYTTQQLNGAIAAFKHQQAKQKQTKAGENNVPTESAA